MSVEAAQHATRNRKVRHTQEETTHWTSVRLAKAKANKAKASTARAKTKGSKDSKDNKDETGVRTRTRTRIRLNVGAVESADSTRKTVGARRTPTKVVRKESTNPRMQRVLTILTRRNQQILNQKLTSVNSRWVFSTLMKLHQQESEFFKIGVGTGAGKTAWPQSVTYGKKLLGHVDFTFRTATGDLAKSDERLYVEGRDDRRVNLRVRVVQAPVCKPLLESTRRWVELQSCMVTKVTCSTEVRMLRRTSMRGSRRR